MAGAVPRGDSVQLCCPTAVECQPQVLWLFLVAKLKKKKVKKKLAKLISTIQFG